MLRWLKFTARRPHEPLKDGERQPRINTEFKAAGHVGRRRELCYWEPIYSPQQVIPLSLYDWDFERDAGPARRFVSGPTLREKIVPGDTFAVVDVTFKDCDFQGDFRPDPLIMFDECDFGGCDFAYSKWKNAHFRKCTFTDSSISLATFEGCEFRDCQWERIGFGSKTEFIHCFINNPAALVTASVSYRNPKDRSFQHRFHQWYRLLSTRAHVLRTLMISHQATGDEHTYYEVVKLHELQSAKARIGEDLYNIRYSKGMRIKSIFGLIFDSADYFILRSLGLLNRWGVSASRPCIALATCWAVFGLLYRYLSFSVSVDRPFQKSFDITFLVGYGNQVSTDLELSILQNVHALFAIVIYTVFFATVVSKLSRAR